MREGDHTTVLYSRVSPTVSPISPGIGIVNTRQGILEISFRTAAVVS